MLARVLEAGPNRVGLLGFPMFSCDQAHLIQNCLWWLPELFEASQCRPQRAASDEHLTADVQGGVKLSGAFDRPQPVRDICCFADHAGKPADEAG